MLGQAMLDRVPPEVPTYATAAAPLPRGRPGSSALGVRVPVLLQLRAGCGDALLQRQEVLAPVHCETRCLKFTANDA